MGTWRALNQVARSIAERTELIEQLSSGEINFRDLAGLRSREIESVTHLARASFDARQFEQAAKLFAGLEALEADRPVHVLHRALAEYESGDAEAATESATRFIDHDLPRSREDLVRALVLRASLLASSDELAAARDIRAATILAEGSEAATAALQRAVR